MSAKWKRGLRPVTAEKAPPGQCRQCGACCAFISIPPFREDELDRLPADIQQVIEWYTHNDSARPKSPAPCYFYDMTGRACLIHEHKPQTCRDFEPGGPACRQERSDLLGALNSYHNAARQWARHYTRVVTLGGRIQEIAEFSLDDEVPDGWPKDRQARCPEPIPTTGKELPTRSPLLSSGLPSRVRPLSRERTSGEQRPQVMAVQAASRASQA